MVYEIIEYVVQAYDWHSAPNHDFVGHQCFSIQFQTMYDSLVDFLHDPLVR